MGKARTDRYGNSKEQKLANENKKLKQAISQLRKRLAKIDLDRYDTIKDMVEEHYTHEKEEAGKEILENLKKTWTCKVCEEGYLEILLYNKMGSTYYFRKCNLCTNRTASQCYDPKQVKGIIKETKDE